MRSETDKRATTPSSRSIPLRDALPRHTTTGCAHIPGALPGWGDANFIQKRKCRAKVRRGVARVRAANTSHVAMIKYPEHEAAHTLTAQVSSESGKARRP